MLKSHSKGGGQEIHAAVEACKTKRARQYVASLKGVYYVRRRVLFSETIDENTYLHERGTRTADRLAPDCIGGMITRQCILRQPASCESTGEQERGGVWYTVERRQLKRHRSMEHTSCGEKLQ